MQDERIFRISKALQCSIVKGVLPKDQWTTWQDHKEKGYYLQPYIDEVEKEIEEKAAWDKM
jgi:ubiquinol-cytochrome c reductase subunit 7